MNITDEKKNSFIHQHQRLSNNFSQIKLNEFLPGIAAVFDKRALDRDLFYQFLGDETARVAKTLSTGRAAGELSLAGLAQDVAVAALVDRRRFRDEEADGTLDHFFDFEKRNRIHFGSCLNLLGHLKDEMRRVLSLKKHY